ncbi:hypothetical protein ACFLIN_03830 [Corynebacterium kutscheri]|uniref:hypothetical protein n=1 Tax=Corynebacterium kutscheri TaxID=35755 RepID=UPI0037C19014
MKMRLSMGGEFEIRRLAGLLKLLLIEVDACKYHPRIVSRERNGDRIVFGSQPPGNLTAISTYDEIRRELSCWARTFDIEPSIADDLCDRIALRAFYVAEHPDAGFFLDDLRVWVHRCEVIVGRGRSITDLAVRTERRQTARSICAKMKDRGHSITRQHLHTWGRRGKITVENISGRPTYLLTEVIAVAIRE